MSENEFLFQFRKLRRLIGEARERQDKCNHNHHCHDALAKINEAESIAFDLQREYEVQAGEKAMEAARVSA